MIDIVTILILIDGFLQYKSFTPDKITSKCHNPYFNRWFSAINIKMHYSNKHKKSQSLF